MLVIPSEVLSLSSLVYFRGSMVGGSQGFLGVVKKSYDKIMSLYVCQTHRTYKVSILSSSEQFPAKVLVPISTGLFLPGGLSLTPVILYL